MKVTANGIKNFAIGAAVLGALSVVAYVVFRGPKKSGQDAGEAVGGFAGGAARGVVRGVTSGLGLPVPDKSKCDAAIAAGDFFGRLNYCPIDRLFASVESSPENKSGTNTGVPAKREVFTPGIVTDYNDDGWSPATDG